MTDGTTRKNTNKESTDRKDTTQPREESEQDARADGGKSSRRVITGPGAADFLAAPGGRDGPDDDAATGARTSDDNPFTGAGRLTPNLDQPSPTTEREIVSPDPPARKKR
jgi:hypothetical protein